jgi:two-component system chemotaxis sensor kinase CheA
MLRVDNETLPLVSLAGILELPTANKNGNGRGPSANPLVIVIGVAEQRLGLLVDDILTEQELAVKTLGKPLLRVRNVEGAALLGTGEPVIVLNAADLIKSARRVQSPVLVMNDHHEDEERKQHIHILVVDDSITTRTLEKNILEAAGYHITTAVDGQEALRLVENMAVDLVVADVQMPQVDGITLTRCLRENPSYSTLPIILVTSLESREDRERGMLAGADAYIIKRGFDQAELLATIEGLL